jgi:hypothetical protein
LARLLAAQEVGQPAGGDTNQPRAGIVGNAVRGPLLDGGNEGVLGGVFGGVEAPEGEIRRGDPLALTRECLCRTGFVGAILEYPLVVFAMRFRV